MIYALRIDEDGYYKGVGVFVAEPGENEITTPITIGYVKPKWTGVEWIEGATEQEIQEWKDNQIFDIKPSFEDLQIEYNVDLDYRLSLIEMGLV